MVLRKDWNYVSTNVPSNFVKGHFGIWSTKSQKYILYIFQKVYYNRHSGLLSLNHMCCVQHTLNITLLVYCGRGTFLCFYAGRPSFIKRFFALWIISHCMSDSNLWLDGLSYTLLFSWVFMKNSFCAEGGIYGIQTTKSDISTTLDAAKYKYWFFKV